MFLISGSFGFESSDCSEGRDKKVIEAIADAVRNTRTNFESTISFSGLHGFGCGSWRFDQQNRVYVRGKQEVCD